MSTDTADGAVCCFMVVDHVLQHVVGDTGAWCCDILCTVFMDMCSDNKVYLVTLPVGLSFCAPHKKLRCVCMCHNHRRVLWTLSDLIHLESQVCVHK